MHIKIIQNNLDKITTVIVSLDAATPETYALTRGGNFDLVIDGCKMIKDLGIQLQNITQTVYYSMPGRPMPGRSVQFTLWVQTISKSHINKIK